MSKFETTFETLVPTTSHVCKLLVEVKIGQVKSSLK
jgi:hypothetical protein